MEYSITDNTGKIDISPHYLGEFANVYEAMRKYPKGGATGDYITILGVKHFWNVNRQSWGILKDKEDNLVQMVEDAIRKMEDSLKNINIEFRSTDTELQYKSGHGNWNTLIGIPDLLSKCTLGGLRNVSDDADLMSQADSLLIRPSGQSEWTVSHSQITQVPFTMTLSGGGTYEKGSSHTVSLSWTYDRDINSQTLNDETLAADVRSRQYTGVVSDTTYTLKAIQGGQTHSKSVSAQFKLKKYYGTSADGTLTNEQILAFSSAWAQRTQSATDFDCTGGKYPYYVLPTSMVSGIRFWIGGLRNTDWSEEVRPVTNVYGHTESYTIFRLNHIQTGVLSIEIK